MIPSPYGWYEDLLTPKLDGLFLHLAEVAPEYLKVEPDLEALKDHLVRHLRPLIGAALVDRDPGESLELAAQLIDILAARHPELVLEKPRADLLRALLDPQEHRRGQGAAWADRALPRTGFTASELFTGRERHLSLAEELRREIRTAQRIDFVVSFLRWSGLRLLLDDLREARDRGVPIRVATTVYLGATDARAVEELANIGADVVVSFNTQQGRLHAKAWIFHRGRDLGTAYVGSSNLSKDALTDGLEWNVKASQRESPTLFRRVSDSFDALRVDPEFELYSPHQREHLERALRTAGTTPGTVRIQDLPAEIRAQIRDHLARTSREPTPEALLPLLRPQGFQQEVLDRLEGERTLHQRFRNLVVLPTGTGKTVVAALDYSKQIQGGQRPRLLFVVHREEILDQARRTFRSVLQDPNFGEIWKGTEEPTTWQHVFGSIQTLNNRQDELRTRWPDGAWFSYVVVDEAHHGTAQSYRFLFDFFRPQILLGLTATPERSDGGEIAQDFHGRFSAEVRLGEGIARGQLVPFHYFGVAEGVPDLSQVAWNRGRYEPAQLEARWGGESFASSVYSALGRVVGQPQKMRALGFCVGLRQAEYLANWFSDHGPRAGWISGSHSTEERRAAIASLTDGELQILFTVDLFNEGVDIPEVDTVLFLRPTESLTVFLQQLGRGLRLSPNKNLLTVLDFVGQAHKDYDFTHKFRGLLGVSRVEVAGQIRGDFPDLPPGCAIHLERQAEVEILKHIEAQIPSTNQKLLTLVSESRDAGFEAFLERTGWDAEFLLKRGTLWYQMLDRLDGVENQYPKREDALAEWVFSSLLTCDSIDLLTLYKESLRSPSLEHVGSDLLTQQWAKNGQVDIWGSAAEAWRWFQSSERRVSEVEQWLDWQIDRQEVRGLAVPHFPHLRQFCSYDFKTIAWGQGRARWGKADVFQGGVHRVGNGITSYWNLYVTIRKSEADYSRDTLYRDWAVSHTEFHWESPNDWVPDSLGGARFLSEIKAEVPGYLFVRELKKDRWGRTPPYLFLGAVELVPDSVRGERPIAMRFRLKAPLPMVHFRRFCQEAVS